MSNSIEGLAGLLSHVNDGRPGKKDRRFRRVWSSNNIGANNGSEDSTGPFYTPICAEMEHHTGISSPQEKRISRLRTALSPPRHGWNDFVRTGGLSMADVLRNSTATNESKHRSDECISDEAVEGNAPNHATSTLEKDVEDVDESRSNGRARRNSISITPDHFYPPLDVRQHSRWGGDHDAQGGAQSDDESQGKSLSAISVARISQEAFTNVMPRSLDMVKYAEQSHQTGPNERKGVRQAVYRPVTSPAKMLLSRQSRFFRTPKWRSPRLLAQPPTQSSSSGALSKQGSVKAIAALFESHGSTEGNIKPPNSKSAEDGQTMSVGSLHKGLSSPRTGLRSSRDDSESPQQLWHGGEDRANPRPLSSSGDDGVEMRAHSLWARRSMPSLRSEDGGAALYARLKTVSSLGTMVPHREQPPVAQYLSLDRPLSMPAASGRSVEEAAIAYYTPLTKPEAPSRSTTVLFAQIQSLQRSLSAKTEEASQLRRQLETQQNAEVGTLSEQLRMARRDLSMWRERTEAAEKRIQVFERLTKRLKDIRAAMVETHQRHSDIRGDALPEHGAETAPGDAEVGELARGEALDGKKPDLGGVDGTWSPMGKYDQARGQNQVWAAVEELLQIGDEGML